MLRFVKFSVLMTLAPLAAPATGQTLSGFERGAQQFKYVTEMHEDNIRLRGMVVDTGQRFDLRVSANGRVKGEFGNQTVRYRVSRETRDRLAARLTAQHVMVSAHTVSR
jgi:hypothetical protein